MAVWLEGRHLLLGSQANLSLQKSPEPGLTGAESPLVLRSFEASHEPRLSCQALTFLTSLVYLGLGDHKDVQG